MTSSFSTEDRALLRDAVSRFVREQYPFSFRQDALASPRGFSEAAWFGMAELGLQGLLLDADEGGSGGGDEELALVMEQIGRGLLLEPFLSTAVLCSGLISSGAEQSLRDRLLPSMSSGRLICALAHNESAMGFARAPVMTRVQSTDGRLVLVGAKSFVLDGPSAQVILVSAQEAGGVSLFAVPFDAPNLTIKPWRTVDGRQAAELSLDQVSVGSGDRIGPIGGMMEDIDAALDRATLAVCAEAIGSMQSLLEQTTAYLQTRRQFGQPLSKFQVLQHRLVDMFIAIEETRALLASGRNALSGDTAERQAAVSAAKYKTGQAARLVGEQAIQLHGAIGMTDDLPVSHHFKRLLMIDAMFGNAGYHLARFRQVTRPDLR